MTNPPILQAKGLSMNFTVHGKGGRTSVVRALQDVSVDLVGGRITGVVGESGSGKSTLAKVLAGFERPTSGELLMDGKPVRIGGRGGHRRHGSQVQMVFQDPFGALNGQRPVRHNLERALRIHGRARSRREAEPLIVELLERVRLVPGIEFIDKLPHELSGGQRQRVCIARALAVQPRVLLGDEPISMLDVSMRLDVLNLLDGLRSDGLAMLYITHDLASARYLCDDLIVMYAGRAVEAGPAAAVIGDPQHPYTQLLLASSPDPARAKREGRTGFQVANELGEPPSLVSPPSGCRFHPRCPLATDRCTRQAPPVVATGPATWAACWAVENADHPTRTAVPT